MQSQPDSHGKNLRSFADDLAKAESLDSVASSHQASFPDVVCVEQQKAEGLSRVLSSWSSTDGELFNLCTACQAVLRNFARLCMNLKF